MSRNRLRATMLAVPALLAIAAACGDEDPPTNPNVRVEITPDSTTANVGVVQRFDVTIFGGSATSPTRLDDCAVSDAALATAVTQTTARACDVMAKAPGRVIVKATASNGTSVEAVLRIVP